MKPGDQEPLRVLALMEATTVTGPAKNLLEFARRVREPNSYFPHGVQLTIATFLRGASSNGFIDRARAEGIPVEPIPEERAFQLSIARDLQRVVHNSKPHIIQTHNIKSHFLVRWLRLYRQHRWIAFHHGYVSTDLKVHVYNQLDRWSLRAADALVAVCGPFADQLVRAGVRRDRVTVRHNMIRPFVPPSPEEVEALRARLGIQPGEQVILSPGRLSREKGHLDLVNAIGVLRDLAGSEPFRVFIVGDGPDRALIEQLCLQLGLNGRVELPGHQSDLRAWYALADMLVLPSHSEGSPNVLLEAFAAGVPVVATAVGGVPEIATDGVHALLVPKGDSEQMARSIAVLLGDAEWRERLAKAALDLTARYTPTAYADSILQLYRRVCEAS